MFLYVNVSPIPGESRKRDPKSVCLHLTPDLRQRIQTLDALAQECDITISASIPNKLIVWLRDSSSEGLWGKQQDRALYPYQVYENTMHIKQGDLRITCELSLSRTIRVWSTSIASKILQYQDTAAPLQDRDATVSLHEERAAKRRELALEALQESRKTHSAYENH